ncbi:uncharacterized protein LOC143432976 [Xylocopa sonorina]|uniref:uncharacterized protein LOC143432976 n=1 Tax=Xylocopa sonorina TaxID=1818115 RepID=UPI00403A8401
MVQMNEMTNLLEQMMNVDIFHPSEKLRMLSDEERAFLDPNLIMDARHRMCREDSSVSPTNDSVLAEAKKSFIQEEARQLYMKKQQRFLERELKKFEMELSKSRPKYLESYACKRRNFASSDDEEFWETIKKLRNKVNSEEKRGQINSHRETSVDPIRKRFIKTETDDTLVTEEGEQKCKQEECEVPCVGSIKVTIKDKANFATETQHLYILRKYFDVLKRNAVEKRQLRDIKIKIEQRMALKIIKKYFNIWRTCTRDTRINVQKQKEEQETSEERKIEMFINAIAERQTELMRSQKPKIRDVKPTIRDSNNTDNKKKNIYIKRIIVESPAQSRLSAQKQIIEKQKAKLAEQNRIIEELKLKQVQEEIFRANKDTVEIVKETLTHCGQKTRRTLIQLMQQNGYRDKSLIVQSRVLDPPQFLLRMEARAEARRKRIKLTEELRRQKLEEQKKKEEAARIEEEQKKRRLQQEALAEARRLRKEQEENRQREIEKFQRLNNIADKFYRKYLLRRYIMKPFTMLIKEKQNNIRKANDYYKEKLLKRLFAVWRKEAKIQYEIKVEIAETFYNENLVTKIVKEWKQMVKEASSKYQVATDYHNMKLANKYFKLWQIITLELKTEYEKKKMLVDDIYRTKLKVRYLGIWKKYLTIIANIKESEERKNNLRKLVQKVIPDFDPIQRGVALDN